MMEIYETSIGRLLLNKDDLVSKTVIEEGFWEPELKEVFDKLLNKDSVVVEIGSYIGDHTVYLSKLCKLVFAIEGFQNNFFLLGTNLLLNNCKNVRCINEIIGNGEEVRECISEDEWSVDWNTNGAGKRFIVTERPTSTAIKLDNLFFRNDISYLKIDAEGFDLSVMRGARNLIESNKPIITFEYNGLISKEPYEEYEEFLFSLGYTIERVGFYNWLAQRRQDV
jgi:FkbM family methyltransferase